MSIQPSLMRVEREAQRLRTYLNLAPLAVLEPHQLAHTMNVQIISPLEIPGVPQAILHHLLIVDRGGWSGGCMRLPDGQMAIVYNPTHAPTRKKATLMEELAHIHLKHRGSKLIPLRSGMTVRSYNKAEEHEAYWVGAAALIPRQVLVHAQAQGLSKQTVAADHGVSLALVRFRQNITHIYLAD